MKVYIGKYLNWFGIYQLFDLLQHIGVSEDKRFDLASKYSESWLANALERRFSRKKRKIDVKIHNYDIWGMDETLAHIVVPMLLKLRENKRSVPLTDNEDVPEVLHCDDTHGTEEDLDKMQAKWDYILDEMLFAFRSKTIESDWEDLYIHIKGDVEIKSDGEVLTVERDSFDREGMRKHQERVSNGFRLFGKYYESLWT